MSKIYKKEGKKKTTWQIFFYTPEGKLKGKTFDRKKDAEDYLAKVQVAKREKRYHDVFDVKKESTTTFNQLLDKYVQNFKTQRSYRNKSFVINKLRVAFGERLLSEIRYSDLETYRNKRKGVPTQTGNLRADGTVNYEMAIFSHIMTKAVEWELLEASPFKRGKRLMYKLDNQRKRFLTAAEIEALLKECSRRIKPIVQTALLTGMRKQELLGLKWEQIRDGFIYLDGAMTKSGKSRQIPINDQLKEVLKEVRQKIQLKSPYVFCDTQGRRFLEVKKALAGACRRAGIEGCTLHTLRHTFASHLVMNGVGLKAVQELLGHADLTMTMRYAHLSQDHLKEAVAVLNNLTDINKNINKCSKIEKGVSNLSLTP